MKYITQQDTFRCGPVAILNALHWAGVDVSYKDSIDILTHVCECKFPKGTKYRPFFKTLRKMGKTLFAVEYVVEPTFGQIERALRKNKAIIWNFKRPHGRHYALIVDMSSTGKTFKIANYGHNAQSLSTIHRYDVSQYVKQNDRLQRVWVLSRIKT